MGYYQQSLASFIKNKLSVNTKGILFDVNLYNDIMGDDFNKKETIENTYKVQKKRQVPTMITNITGEYIPIPNLNGTNNSLEIIFDLAVDDMTGQEEETEFETVNYNNTLLAIDEFKNSLLANYFPLGDRNIMLGGEESKIDINYTTPFNMETIRLTFTPLDTESETILQYSTDTLGKLEKDGTNIIFNNEIANTLTIPYTPNVEIDLVIYKFGGSWYLTDGTNISSAVSTQVIPYTSITIGGSTGLNVKIKSLTISSEDYLSTELEEINISDFDDKDLIVNDGSYTLATIVPTNCILFGSDGNAVFQVYPLAVIGEYQSENGTNYHSFSLQLEAMIGDNFIFGNNFEYYIDDIRVYPVDRNHTFALDTQGRQGINDNVMSFIGSESALDFTQSFFYQPTRKLSSLVKKITTGDIDQNTIYTIKVQYPFWSKEYDVVIEGGGINTDINSITTFSLQFKLADDILTP